MPIAKLLGRKAVPSALAIGSVVPDAWYLLPFLDRADSHGVLGALWFCLPAGLIAYAAFHLIFKQPMLALLPRRVAARLARWSTPRLPDVPWRAVLVSLLAGIATHLVWDAFTHAGHVTLLETRLFGEIRLHQVLQHGSTLIGTAFLAGWLWRKLRATDPRGAGRELPTGVHLAVVGAMVIVPAVAFASVLPQFEIGAFRSALRAAGITAVCVLGFIALAFCLAWHCWRSNAEATRGRAGR